MVRIIFKTPVVQDLLCGKSTEEAPDHREKGLSRTVDKDAAFIALGLGGMVLYLPTIARDGFFWCLNIKRFGAIPLHLAFALEVRYPPRARGYLSDTCAIPH